MTERQRRVGGRVRGFCPHRDLELGDVVIPIGGNPKGSAVRCQTLLQERAKRGVKCRYFLARDDLDDLRGLLTFAEQLQALYDAGKPVMRGDVLDGQ